MTTAALPTRITPGEFLRMPNAKAMEFVDGQPLEGDMSFLSCRTATRIIRLLEAHAERVPVAVVCDSTIAYQCFQALVDDPERIRRPDVTVIRADRFASLNDPNPGVITIPPDLAVEVISTHDTYTLVERKLEEYESADFPLVWVVHPLARTVTVHPFPGKPMLLTADDEISAESVLPGFACQVSDLFPRPLP
jgi:Uma2 family endonuclease